MDKLSAVERAFRNSDAFVFYDEPSDTVYVCFGNIVSEDKEIKFMDCQIADENGDLLPDVYDVSFGIHTSNPNVIPSRFYEGDLIDVVKVN